jgi:SAM-dependent methyltransferase
MAADRHLGAEEELGSWDSREYVAQWLAQDVIADMLTLPRRISVALVVDADVDVDHVVDLGSGPGAYLDVFLECFPQARGTWVDSSESMEAVARERLARFDDRVAYVLGDVRALDELVLEPAQVVTSSRTIHHLPAHEIERLYRDVHAVLSPGGFFYNLDHSGVPEGWEPRYRRIRPRFTGPPPRDIAPHRHDFPFCSIPAHLGWLEQAGFEAPDTPWRTFYTALFAARKPG